MLLHEKVCLVLGVFVLGCSESSDDLETVSREEEILESALRLLNRIKGERR